jgi:hypothetical protein
MFTEEKDNLDVDEWAIDPEKEMATIEKEAFSPPEESPSPPINDETDDEWAVDPEKEAFSTQGTPSPLPEKPSFSHSQPSIALFSFKHVSGCLEVALSLPGIRTIDYILVPDTKEAKRLLWRKELTAGQTETLYRMSERCVVYSEECSACGRERAMVDRGRPLCDECWEKECDQAAKQIVKHGKKP